MPATGVPPTGETLFPLLPLPLRANADKPSSRDSHDAPRRNRACALGFREGMPIERYRASPTLGRIGEYFPRLGVIAREPRRIDRRPSSPGSRTLAHKNLANSPQCWGSADVRYRATLTQVGDVCRYADSSLFIW